MAERHGAVMEEQTASGGESGEMIDTNGTVNGVQSMDGIDLSKLKADFAFRGPIELRMAVETAAAEQKLPVSQYLLNLVAGAHGYQVQPGATRKTMTEEERKAKLEADKARAKAERQAVKARLDAARKGTTGQGGE